MVKDDGKLNLTGALKTAMDYPEIKKAFEKIKADTSNIKDKKVKAIEIVKMAKIEAEKLNPVLCDRIKSNAFQYASVVTGLSISEIQFLTNKL